MKIAIYARQSKWVEDSESIETQISLCKDSCTSIYKEAEFITYIDEGFSGRTTNRPEFQTLLEDIELNKIDCVAVYRLDRVSRSVLDFSNLITLLRQKNISFISIKEQFDTSTFMGETAMYISSIYAQFESDITSQRVKDNTYSLASKGYWLGGICPLGYKSTKTKEVDIYNKNNKKTYHMLAIKEEDAEVLIFIFDEYLKLRSGTLVAERLNELNFKTKRGNKWTSNAINNVLNNITPVKCTEEVVKYLDEKNIQLNGEPDGIHGIIAFGKNKDEEIYTVGKHVGIIDGDTWLQAQKILGDKKAQYRRSANKDIFRKNLKCGICGSNMYRFYKSAKEGQKPTYYRCNNKKRYGKDFCKNTNLSLVTLKNSIESVILKEVKKNIDTIENKTKVHQLNCISILEQQLQQKEIELNKWKELLKYSKNTFVKKKVLDKLNDIKKEEKTLKLQLDNVNKKIKAGTDYRIREEELFKVVIEKVEWFGNDKEIRIIYKDKDLKPSVHRLTE